MGNSARVAVVAVIAILRAAWTLRRQPTASPDSVRYWNPADPLSTFRFDLAQGPGQLLQVLYLLPIEAAVALQAVASAALWGWACWVATNGLPRWWFWVALAFAQSPWWIIWDGRVLTEAVTLAAMALFTAGAVRWVRGDGAVPVLVGAAIALLARPLTVPLIIAIGLAAVIARQGWPRPRWAAIAVGALAVFAMVQTVVFNSAPVSYEYVPAPMTMDGVRAADRFVSRGHVDGYHELARDHGMPDCPAALEVPRGVPGIAPLWFETCDSMVEWLREGGVPWHAELTQNPGPTLLELVSGRWLSDAWAGYALTDDRWLELRHTARAYWWPAVAVMDIAMWSVLLLSALWLLRPGGGWLWRIAVTVLVLGFAGALWIVDGLEPWRHVLPAMACLTPAALASCRRAC